MATHFHNKARLNLREDKQTERIYYDPEGLYAPVATYEAIRMLLGITSAYDLLLDGSDVDSAYNFGMMYGPILMDQPTDANGIARSSGCVCLLVRTHYGVKLAGKIWGAVLHSEFLKWGFTQPTVDDRVFVS